MTQTIKGQSSYSVHNGGVVDLNKYAGTIRQFFQYELSVPTVIYAPNIVTGFENVLWWAAPVFGAILTLLGAAALLGLR